MKLSDIKYYNNFVIEILLGLDGLNDVDLSPGSKLDEEVSNLLRETEVDFDVSRNLVTFRNTKQTKEIANIVGEDEKTLVSAMNDTASQLRHMFDESINESQENLKIMSDKGYKLYSVYYEKADTYIQLFVLSKGKEGDAYDKEKDFAISGLYIDEEEVEYMDEDDSIMFDSLVDDVDEYDAEELANDTNPEIQKSWEYAVDGKHYESDHGGFILESKNKKSSKLPTLEELHEAKMAKVKRSHTEKHPAINADMNAKMRNQIIEFIGSHDRCRVTREELLEYFNQMNEDDTPINAPSRSWVHKNKHLIEAKTVKGKKCYELTRAGKNLYEKLKSMNESKVNETMFYDYSLQGHEATDDAALQAVSGLDWSEFETKEHPLVNLTFIDSKDGIDIWRESGTESILFSVAESKVNELYQPKVNQDAKTINLVNDHDVNEVEKKLNDAGIKYWKRRGKYTFKFEQTAAFDKAVELLKLNTNESKEDKVAEFLIELEKAGYDVAPGSNEKKITLNKPAKSDDILSLASVMGINASYDEKTGVIEISGVNEEYEVHYDKIKKIVGEYGSAAQVIYDTLKGINNGVKPNEAFSDAIDNENMYGQRADIVAERNEIIKSLKDHWNVDVKYINESANEEKSQGGLSGSVWNQKPIQTYTDEYGWIYNSNRTDELDKKLEQILNDAGFSAGEIAAFMVSTYGRHLDKNFTGIDKAISDLRAHFAERGTDMFEAQYDGNEIQADEVIAKFTELREKDKDMSFKGIAAETALGLDLGIEEVIDILMKNNINEEDELSDENMIKAFNAAKEANPDGTKKEWMTTAASEIGCGQTQIWDALNRNTINESSWDSSWDTDIKIDIEGKKAPVYGVVIYDTDGWVSLQFIITEDDLQKLGYDNADGSLILWSHDIEGVDDVRSLDDSDAHDMVTGDRNAPKMDFETKKWTFRDIEQMMKDQDLDTTRQTQMFENEQTIINKIKGDDKLKKEFDRINSVRNKDDQLLELELLNDQMKLSQEDLDFLKNNFAKIYKSINEALQEQPRQGKWKLGEVVRLLNMAAKFPEYEQQSYDELRWYLDNYKNEKDKGETQLFGRPIDSLINEYQEAIDYLLKEADNKIDKTPKDNFAEIANFYRDKNVDTMKPLESVKEAAEFGAQSEIITKINQYIADVLKVGVVSSANNTIVLDRKLNNVEQLSLSDCVSDLGAAAMIEIVDDNTNIMINENEMNDGQNNVTVKTKDYTWLVQKIDGTHLKMAINPEDLQTGRAAVYHIEQLKDYPYYKDLKAWLGGEDTPAELVYEDADGKDTIKVTDDDGDWWLTKVDSTHVDMVNDPKYAGQGGMSVLHVDQLKGRWFYDKIIKWLHGEDIGTELVNEAVTDSPEIFAKQMIINAVVNNNPNFDKNLAMKRLTQDLDDTKRNIESYKKRQSGVTDKAGLDSVISKYERWQKELESEINSNGKWVEKLLNDVKNKDFSEIDKWDDKGNLTLGTFREETKINELQKVDSRDANNMYPGYNEYPNIHQSGSLTGMKKLYGWDTTYLYQIDGYIYNLKGHPNVSEAADGGDFNYRLLGRLQSDCEYFLGNGGGSERSLWADTVEEQIAKMKELWNGLPKDGKPEWLSMEEIEKYEKDMLAMKSGVNEAKQVDTEISNLWIKKLDRDVNGNKTISVGFPNDIGTSIQLSSLRKAESVLRGITNMKEFGELSDSDKQIVIKDVIEYVQKYGSKDMQSRLKLYEGIEDGWNLRYNPERSHYMLYYPSGDIAIEGNEEYMKHVFDVASPENWDDVKETDNKKVKIDTSKIGLGGTLNEAGEMDIINPDKLSSYPEDVRSAIKFWKQYASFETLYSAWNSYSEQNPHHKNKNFLKELNVAVESGDTQAILDVVNTEAAYGVESDDTAYVERVLKNMDIGVYEADEFDNPEEIKKKLDAGEPEVHISGTEYMTKEGDIYNLHSGGFIVQKLEDFDEVYSRSTVGDYNANEDLDATYKQEADKPSDEFLSELLKALIQDKIIQKGEDLENQIINWLVGFTGDEKKAVDLAGSLIAAWDDGKIQESMIGDEDKTHNVMQVMKDYHTHNIYEDHGGSIKKEFPDLSDEFIKKLDNEWHDEESAGLLDRISTMIAKELGQIGDNGDLVDKKGYQDTISKTFKIHKAYEGVNEETTTAEPIIDTVDKLKQMFTNMGSDALAMRENPETIKIKGDPDDTAWVERAKILLGVLGWKPKDEVKDGVLLAVNESSDVLWSDYYEVSIPKDDLENIYSYYVDYMEQNNIDYDIMSVDEIDEDNIDEILYHAELQGMSIAEGCDKNKANEIHETFKNSLPEIQEIGKRFNVAITHGKVNKTNYFEYLVGLTTRVVESKYEDNKQNKVDNVMAHFMNNNVRRKIMK